MKRRAFLGGITGLALTRAAAAQTTRTVRRIGVLGNFPPSVPVVAPLSAAFIAGLRERGWVEGQNLSIEGRWAAGSAQRFAEFAGELVALDVEVIVALGWIRGHSGSQGGFADDPDCVLGR